MGRAPCCDKANVKRGPWSPDEDATLKRYLEAHGTGGNWIALPQKAGLSPLSPTLDVAKVAVCGGSIISGQILNMEASLKRKTTSYALSIVNWEAGKPWSLIASQLPGRTDNDVKNYWNTKLKKKHHAGKTSSSMTNATNSNVLLTNGNNPALPCSSPSLQYCDPKAVATSVALSDFSQTRATGTLPTFSDIGYEPLSSQSLSLSPFDQFSFPGVMEVSEFGTSRMNNHIVSSSEEASSISDSSFTMDSKYLSLPGNGGLEDGILMGSQYDFAPNIAFSCYLPELGYVRPQVLDQ
ncbi:hypothetical protein Tsubulata_025288, partial [Turnera subulata]